MKIKEIKLKHSNSKFGALFISVMRKHYFELIKTKLN